MSIVKFEDHNNFSEKVTCRIDEIIDQHYLSKGIPLKNI